MTDNIRKRGAAREAENLRFLEEAKLWADLQRELGAAPALKEAVTAVLDRKGLTWMELALRKAETRGKVAETGQTGEITEYSERISDGKPGAVSATDFFETACYTPQRELKHRTRETPARQSGDCPARQSGDRPARQSGD